MLPNVFKYQLILFVIMNGKDFVKLCNLGGDTLEERQRVIVKQKEIIEQHIQEYKGYLKVVNKKLNLLAESHG